MSDKNILRLNLYLSVILFIMLLVTIALVYRMIVIQKNHSQPVQVAQENREIQLGLEDIQAVARVEETEENSNSKVADNVTNSWYCSFGTNIESGACLLFLKEDGSVSYIRYYLDDNSNVNATDEKVLEGVSNISNVLVEDSIKFVQEDGTAIDMSLTELDNLTK